MWGPSYLILMCTEDVRMTVHIYFSSAKTSNEQQNHLAYVNLLSRIAEKVQLFY